MINVIGLGVGNLDYFSKAGENRIKTSDIIIGGERQLEDVSHIIPKVCKVYTLKKLSDMLDFIKLNLDKNISIIVSGDTGFYSLLKYIKKNLPNKNIEVITNISSFQYLFAKICDTWEDFTLLSVHGRENDIVKALKKSKRGLILLTDSKNNPYEIAKTLADSGYQNTQIIVGERLSYSDEKITRFYAKDYKSYQRDYQMNVVILEKESQWDI